jgi:serine protease Do
MIRLSSKPFDFVRNWQVPAALACLLAAAPLGAQDPDAEEEAIRAAVEAVAPSVIRLETVGGREKIGRTVVSPGPTTGVVVAEDGYVISSAYSFVNQPTTILAVLASGKRVAAKIVARDKSRMLVLLKLSTEEKLAPPVAIPRKELAVGQTAIAIGRTIAGDKPNFSVGVVSALHRIWGKAIQSDAKVSPANYGGPLIDLQGRVIGILAPLSPHGQGGELAGLEWYDSGIGFAVPLVDVIARLDTLKAGTDISSGILGISLKRGDMFTLPPEIAACRSDSPAAKAGLKKGDLVIAVNGQPVIRQAQFRHAMGPHDAGENVTLTARRGQEEITAEVRLIDKLPPFVPPFLGILPLRLAKKPGVSVRFVYPDSPAAKLHIEAGDRITALDGQPVATPDELRDRLATRESKTKPKLTITRGEESRDAEFTPDKLPVVVPKKLPSALAKDPEAAERTQATGLAPIKLAEEPNKFTAYVPETYQPNVPHGLVVVLSPPGDFDEKAFAARWKPLAEEFQLIVLAPQPAEEGKWKPAEAGVIRKGIDRVIDEYRIDRQRVALYGYQAGGVMAWLVTSQHLDLIRGLAVVDALPPGTLGLPENDPLLRLAFYLAAAEKTPAGLLLPRVAAPLSKENFAVTLKTLPATRDLDAEELAELVRWIDSLDRI